CRGRVRRRQPCSLGDGPWRRRVGSDGYRERERVALDLGVPDVDRRLPAGSRSRGAPEAGPPRAATRHHDDGAAPVGAAVASHRRRVRVLTQRPEAAGVPLRFYHRAERRFGVSWAVLASVNFIESKFGRVRSASSAGAQGPMQFIPSTWAAYGMSGDVHDPHDAILGAANYLHASGAPGDYARALYSYNHAIPYVTAVLLYARRMANDPYAFFEYYNW